MKYNKTLALVPALLLAACGGDEQSVNPKAAPGSVIYSYPADGQMDVSPEADIVLRFSDALTEEKADLKNKISLISGDEDIDFGIEKIDGGKSLKLTTDGVLQTASKYSVTFDEPLKAAGNRSISIPGNLDDSDIHFNTRGSYSSVAELAETDDVFKIAQQIPASDGEDSPFSAMNFSTFRLILTQPVHPEWDSEERGGSIKLLDQDGQTVPATVLVKGNRITVDPCVTPEKTQCGSKNDILNSGETYTLKLKNLTSLTSPDVEYKGPEELEYTPRDTGPTIVLKQSATDSGLANGMSEEAATKSILNGQPINGVTLNSVLQGKAGPSQQTGDMFAELAYAPAFEDNEALPLRIPKGSVLSSTSLDVLVGGKVPVLDAATGELQTTGDIKVTMLSDASGYMSPNPYTNDTSAPRQITLFMDVSMNAEEGQPNAALSQDLMGVELRGIALVRDGVLTIDAIGMVEPALLGQEYTDSTIAFHLEAATDIDSALDADDLREIDRTGPSLVSWMPGDEDAIPDTRQSMQRPGDPVILFFDKPLDPDSVADGVSLSGPGGTSDGETTVGNGLNAEVDGTTLTLNPDGGLIPGGDYIVSVPSLRGINGKPVERAGSTNTDAVIRALEGHRYSFLKDEQYWREFDHQNVQTVYVVRIKPRETVVADQFSSDYFEIIDFLPGDEAAQTREEWEQRRKEAGKPTRL
ncbi:MAG: Ig-like domain-containing protein [Oleiphilaceae bacterium]